MVLSVFANARRHFLDAAAGTDFDYANRLLQGNASFAEASVDTAPGCCGSWKEYRHDIPLQPGNRQHPPVQ